MSKAILLLARILPIGVFALAIHLIVSSSSVRADISFEIGFDSNQYDVAVGESQQVAVFFREIRNGSSAARLSTATLKDGLFATGFELRFSTNTLNASNAVRFDSFVLNSAANRFDPSFFTINATPEINATQIAKVDAQSRDDVNGIEVDPIQVNGRDVFQVEIGRFTLVNVGPTNAITTLQLSESAVPFANLFVDGVGPAAISYGTAQLGSISAVPEPTSIALIAIGLAVVGYRRFRK